MRSLVAYDHCPGRGQARNFSRAAQELHVAQPVLSRQIRALETKLGAALFVRDSRGAALTPADAQLALDAEPLLADAETLRRNVARAERGLRTFTIAFMPGLIATGPARALGRNHPRSHRRGPAHRLGQPDRGTARRPSRRQLRPPPRRPAPTPAPAAVQRAPGAALPADHRLAAKPSAPSSLRWARCLD